MAGEPVSRILCGARSAKRITRCGDHSSSPGIATGIQQPTRGFSINDDLRHRQWSASIFMNVRSSSRAGSPLLFGLAPRGVFRAPDVAIGAVGSYPTFSPLPKRCEHFEDVSQVSLRDATALHLAGGLFSVALSVNSSTGFSLCSSLRPRHLHHVAEAAQPQARATAPLALPGALPCQEFR